MHGFYQKMPVRAQDIFCAHLFELNLCNFSALFTPFYFLASLLFLLICLYVFLNFAGWVRVFSKFSHLHVIVHARLHRPVFSFMSMTTPCLQAVYDIMQTLHDHQRRLVKFHDVTVHALQFQIHFDPFLRLVAWPRVLLSLCFDASSDDSTTAMGAVQVPLMFVSFSFLVLEMW
jgi:hypothetical protein